MTDAIYAAAVEKVARAIYAANPFYTGEKMERMEWESINNRGIDNKSVFLREATAALEAVGFRELSQAAFEALRIQSMMDGWCREKGPTATNEEFRAVLYNITNMSSAALSRLTSPVAPSSQERQSSE